MARTPKDTPAKENVASGIPAAHQEHVEIVSELTTITQGYSDERDLMNQIMGQIQMADALSKLTTVVSLQKLAHIKETKMYRAIAGKKAIDANGEEIADVGTWEGFCRAIGTTKSKVDEDILNLKSFGENALNSLTQVGAGYRELRQLRKLPEGDRTALLEIAKTGDKESLIDLLEDVVSKHAKEKEALASKLADLEADQKATEKVLTEKNKKLDKANTSLEKLQLRTASWDERVAPFKEEITQRQSIIDEAVARHLQAIEALDTWTNKELASQPDYDAENDSKLPVEVLTVLLHLSDAVERTATLVANAQHELRLRFGGYIDEARQHLMNA